MTQKNTKLPAPFGISSTRRQVLSAGSAAALTGLLPRAGFAQANFPNRPIKLIIPFAPGGSTDIVGRLLAARMGQILGQPMVVENRAGGGGTVGAEVIAKSTPDGYTIGMGTVSTCGTAVSTYKNLKYDPRKDYAPIVNIASVPGVIAVHPSFPAKNYAEFIKEIKSKPGKYNYAHSGNGAVGHMAMELFKFQTNTFMTSIGYRGAGPALNDVLGGQVPIIWDNLSSSLPHIKAGKLVAIGLAYDVRVAQLPELPTFFELGLKNYDAATWYGLVAPAGTPSEIVNRLNAETVKLLKDPDFARQVNDAGGFPIGNTPAQFATQIEKEIVKWAAIAKFAKVTADS